MFKIFSDFDNTITKVDCTDYILHNFASKNWLNYEEDFKNNKIFAKECLQKQIGLLNIDIKDLEYFILNKISIDEGFLNFVKICEECNYPLTIVSDGLDFVIKLILKKYSLTHIPFYSNKLNYNKTSYELLSPFISTNCKGHLGTCKCNIINHFKNDDTCIYIGDGSSDFCVVKNIPNLVVFAKDKLADFCITNQIKHFSFTDFFDINAILNHLKRNINE